jgi:hypothetical protein
MRIEHQNDLDRGLAIRKLMPVMNALVYFDRVAAPLAGSERTFARCDQGYKPQLELGQHLQI